MTTDAEIFIDAAKAIRERGHAKHHLVNGNGCVCLIGALNVARHGDPLHFDEGMVIAATDKLVKFIPDEQVRDAAQLMTSDGKRCCVGFVCLAYGATEEAITGAGNPRNAHDLPHRFDGWDFSGATNSPGYMALYAAFAINDMPIGHVPGTERALFGQMSPEVIAECAKYGEGAIVDFADREARLVKLFAEQGIELVFEGEYVPAPIEGL